MLRFTQFQVKQKPGNFYLLDWKPNIMSLTSIQLHAILHQKDTRRQHHFQLYQQRNLLCSFYTCDSLVKNNGDSKKQRSFTSICQCECLVVFHAVQTYQFSMHALTKNHSISWKIIDSPHQSRPHKKILFSRYIISQSSRG